MLRTQGHKSLGLPIRVTANKALAHKASRDEDEREEKGENQTSE
jgi:hypothetical protein